MAESPIYLSCRQVGQAVISSLSQSRQYRLWNLGASSNVLPLASLMMHFCCANIVWKPASSHLPIEIRVKAMSGAYSVSLNMILVSLPWILVGINSIPIPRASKVSGDDLFSALKTSPSFSNSDLGHLRHPLDSDHFQVPETLRSTSYSKPFQQSPTLLHAPSTPTPCPTPPLKITPRPPPPPKVAWRPLRTPTLRSELHSNIPRRLSKL